MGGGVRNSTNKWCHTITASTHSDTSMSVISPMFSDWALVQRDNDGKEKNGDDDDDDDKLVKKKKKVQNDKRFMFVSLLYRSFFFFLFFFFYIYILFLYFYICTVLSPQNSIAMFA